MAKSITLSGRSTLVPPGVSLKPIIEADLVAGQHEIGALEQGEKARVQMRLEYSEDAGRYEIARSSERVVDATAGVEPATLPGMNRSPGPPGSPR